MIHSETVDVIVTAMYFLSYSALLTIVFLVYQRVKSIFLIKKNYSDSIYIIVDSSENSNELREYTGVAIDVVNKCVVGRFHYEIDDITGFINKHDTWQAEYTLKLNEISTAFQAFVRYYSNYNIIICYFRKWPWHNMMLEYRIQNYKEIDIHSFASGCCKLPIHKLLPPDSVYDKYENCLVYSRYFLDLVYKLHNINGVKLKIKEKFQRKIHNENVFWE